MRRGRARRRGRSRRRAPARRSTRRASSRSTSSVASSAQCTSSSTRTRRPRRVAARATSARATSCGRAPRGTSSRSSPPARLGDVEQRAERARREERRRRRPRGPRRVCALLAEALEQRGLADAGLAVHERRAPRPRGVDARERLGEHGELEVPLEQLLLHGHTETRSRPGLQDGHPRRFLPGVALRNRQTRLARLALRADVAELVDAHGSGPCGLRLVEVQVLSSA